MKKSSPALLNIRDYEIAAAKKIRPDVDAYFNSGAWDESTLLDNVSAYQKFRILPRVLRNVRSCELSTQILGKDIQVPFLVAPMAYQGMLHADAEFGTAKAAVEMGAGMVLSTVSSKSLEAVASAVPKKSRKSPLWFQLYWFDDRAINKDLILRAKKAGYDAICVTVDSPVFGSRERSVREPLNLKGGIHYESLRPYFTSQQLSEGNFLGKFYRESKSPTLNWKDLEWIKSITDLPIILKGVLHPADAVLALNAGINAIVISNHGGRQLDGSIATIDALTLIAPKLKGKMEVYVDGGIRRGSDILRAIALGAHAVLVGRPVLWGLKVGGQKGALHVLKIFSDELQLAMRLSGCTSIAEITNDLIYSRS